VAIRSFKDGRLAELYSQRRIPKGFSADLAGVTRLKLRMLNNPADLVDLRAPPATRLEALRGDREGQHSIRVNDQFRLCFRWTEDGPIDVEFTDYD
jgi:proteic killer suppression protein